MSQESLLQKEAKMMKLEKLIAQRESVSTKPFPVPVKELLQRYEQLYTGAISDVLREFCLLDQALPGHLRPLRDSDVVAGIAFTVKSAPNAATAIAWVCVATFGFGMWSANILALHADIFPAETIGTAVGFTLMAASLGGAIFTYLVGQFVDKTGYAPVFGAVGMLALMACLGLFFLVGRAERI